MRHRESANIQERRCKISVRRGVDAVGDHSRESQIACELLNVDGVARAGNRARPERHHISFGSGPLQAVMVTAQRGDVSQEKVRGKDWLSRAQVRERGHHRVPSSCGLPRKRAHTGLNSPLHDRNATAQVQTQIEGHLLVAGTSCMEATTRVTNALDELPFDKAVDVLVRPFEKDRIRPVELQELSKSLFDQLAVIVGHDPGSRERPCPGRAPAHIVLKEPAIEPE